MRRPMLLTLTLALASCASSSVSDGKEKVPARIEPASVTVSRVEGVPSAPDDRAPELHDFEILEGPTAVPTGVFSSLDALCAAQRALVRDQIARAREELSELRGEPVRVSARCAASAFDPAKVDVKLRAPYLEVRALEIETGYAIEVHVVARTAEGWQTAPAASESARHDDPGCLAIERDTGIEAIRVEGERTPALVIVAGSDTIHDVEVEEASFDEPAPYVLWSDVSKHVVSCRLGSTPTCDERVAIRLERVPSDTAGGRTTTVRFQTTYAVDDAGRVVPKDRVETAKLD